MEPPSLASPSLSSTFSPLQDSISSEDDLDDDLPSPPPPDIMQVPKWARDTIDAVGLMEGKPSNTHHTHAQTSGIGLLSHAISNDPQSFSQVIGHLDLDMSMDEE